MKKVKINPKTSIILLSVLTILGIVSCTKKDVKPSVDTLEFFWREVYLEDNKSNFISFDSIVKRARGSYQYTQWNFQEVDNKLIGTHIIYKYTYGQPITTITTALKDTFNLEYSKLATKQGGPFTQDGRSFTVIRVSKVSGIYRSFYQREMGRDNKYVSIGNRR